jgi:hypothetical protein
VSGTYQSLPGLIRITPSLTRAGGSQFTPLNTTLVKIQKGENAMDKIIELWLNPINLGILFLCVTVGIWILAHSDPTRKK